MRIGMAEIPNHKTIPKIYIIDVESDEFLTYTAFVSDDESHCNVYMAQSFMDKLSEIIRQVKGNDFYVSRAYAQFDKELNCFMHVETNKAGENQTETVYKLSLPGSILMEIVTVDDYIRQILKNIF